VTGAGAARRQARPDRAAGPTGRLCLSECDERLDPRRPARMTPSLRPRRGASRRSHISTRRTVTASHPLKYDATMDLTAIPTFAADQTFHVVVESPRGSSVKLKYEARWQTMSISRPLALGLTYPCDWGFVPSTKAADGDPADALIYWDTPTFPGVVLTCRAAGVLQVEQNHAGDRTHRIRNDRIVAVPLASRRDASLVSVDQLSQRVRDELASFMVASTVFEGKDATILGWDGPIAALALLKRFTE
jgi:inorganic pyrophosphatase